MVTRQDGQFTPGSHHVSCGALPPHASVDSWPSAPRCDPLRNRAEGVGVEGFIVGFQARRVPAAQGEADTVNPSHATWPQDR